MRFHFQNVRGFESVVFTFSEKHNCKQKSLHSQITTNSFTDEVVNKQQNIFKAFKFVCSTRDISPLNLYIMTLASTIYLHSFVKH